MLTTAPDCLAFVQAALAGKELSGATYAAWFLPRMNGRQGGEAEDLHAAYPIDPRFPTLDGVKTGRCRREWIYVIRSNELRNC